MDEIITEDGTGPNCEMEKTLILSSKQPRMDCAATGNYHGKITFEIPQLVTFQKSEDEESSVKTRYNKMSLKDEDECQHDDYHNRVSQINVTSIAATKAEHAPTETVPANGVIKRAGPEGGMLHISPKKLEDVPTLEINLHKRNVTEISADNDLIMERMDASTGGGNYRSVPAPPIKYEVGMASCSDCRPTTEMEMLMVKSNKSHCRTDTVILAARCLNTQTFSHDSEIPLSQKCSDGSPLLPSVPFLFDRVLGGFDTFQKIQLSPDEEDKTGGLGQSPLTSSPRQLLKTSRRQFLESNNQREISEGVEVKREETIKMNQNRRENLVNGGFDDTNSSSEMAVALPELRPDIQSNPTLCAHFPSDFGILVPEARPFTEFEMKEKFNLVMVELNLFFEIITSEPPDFKASSSEGVSVLTGPEEADTLDTRKGPCRPAVGSQIETTTSGMVACLSLGEEDIDDEAGGGQNCANGAAVVLSCGTEPEQEVPPDCSQHCLDGEDSMYSSGKHREQQEEEKSAAWNRAFTSPSSEEQLRQRQLDPPRRLEPLKTCARPIRIGLSKRAKPTHLHRNHPYK